MAIAFDAVSDGSISTSANLRIPHTISGSDRILFVYVLTASTTHFQQPEGVLYDNVDLTVINSISFQDGGIFFVFSLRYIIAPHIGTHDIYIFSTTELIDQIVVWATSYTGVDQTSPIESNSVNHITTPSTTFTQSLTTINDNCWVISGAENHIVAQFAVSGCTFRSSGGGGIFDSNGPISPAGLATFVIGAGTAQNWSGIITAFKPVITTPTLPSQLTLLGVG